MNKITLHPENRAKLRKILDWGFFIEAIPYKVANRIDSLIVIGNENEMLHSISQQLTGEEAKKWLESMYSIDIYTKLAVEKCLSFENFFLRNIDDDYEHALIVDSTESSQQSMFEISGLFVGIYSNEVVETAYSILERQYK